VHREVLATHKVNGRLSQRLKHIYLPLVLYVGVCILVFCLFDQDPSTVCATQRVVVEPMFDLGQRNSVLVLAFLMMDSARMCREFILALNEGTTNYPEATRRHFARQRGEISENCLNDWIDLQLIADLTERVGGLVYYPAVLLFGAPPCAQRVVGFDDVVRPADTGICV